jgi:hypothetical protein
MIEIIASVALVLAVVFTVADVFGIVKPAKRKYYPFVLRTPNHSRYRDNIKPEPARTDAKTVFARVSDTTDEAILEAAGKWMQYCAVSAFNGTISTSGDLDFETWLSCCRTSWIGRCSSQLNVSPNRICSVMRQFARANTHREKELRAALENRQVS